MEKTQKTSCLGNHRNQRIFKTQLHGNVSVAKHNSLREEEDIDTANNGKVVYIDVFLSRKPFEV